MRRTRRSRPTLPGNFILAATALVCSGCAATSVTTTPVYQPVFDFTPPEGIQPTSANVVFALVSPRYSEAGLTGSTAPVWPSSYTPWTDVEPFSAFARSLDLDFQELLIARGFSMTGPFLSRGEMTFPEMEGSDFALVAVLEVRPVSTNVGAQGQILAFGPDNVISGTEVLSGRMTLSINETLSGERMWFKSIALPERRIAWTSDRRYTDQDATMLMSLGPRAGGILAGIGDPGYLNPVGKALEEFYPTILNEVWAYLDPNEMQLLKETASELKERYVPFSR